MDFRSPCGSARISGIHRFFWDRPSYNMRIVRKGHDYRWRTSVGFHSIEVSVSGVVGSRKEAAASTEPGSWELLLVQPLAGCGSVGHRTHPPCWLATSHPGDVPAQCPGLGLPWCPQLGWGDEPCPAAPSVPPSPRGPPAAPDDTQPFRWTCHGSASQRGDKCKRGNVLGGCLLEKQHFPFFYS